MTIKEIFLEFGRVKNIPVTVVPLGENLPEQLGIIIIGENGSYEGYAMCLEEEDLFVFYVNLGVKIPRENRGAVAQKILELNFQIKLGGFQIEPEQGQVSVRICQYLSGADQEKAQLLERVIHHCGIIADTYYKELLFGKMHQTDGELEGR